MTRESREVAVLVYKPIGNVSQQNSESDRDSHVIHLYIGIDVQEQTHISCQDILHSPSSFQITERSLRK